MRSASCGRFSERGLAPRSKYSRRNAEEYFGHRKSLLTRERQQGLENFSFRCHPVSFGYKRNGVVFIKNPSKSSTCNIYKKNTKGRLPAALCVLSGECVFGEAYGFFLYNCRRGCEAHRSSAKNYKAVLPPFRKAFAFGTATV